MQIAGTLLAAVITALVFWSPLSAQRQTQPIAKAGVLRVLKKKSLSGRQLIRQIENRKVSFRMSTGDEVEIRDAGKYLSAKMLDDLIDAIRFNWKEPAGNQPKEPSISQAMTNSPGGIQIGGNLTVNPSVVTRRLSEEQQNRLLIALENKPKGQIIVSCLVNDGPEPCAFARQLAEILRSKARWTIPPVIPRMGFGDSSKRVAEVSLLVQSRNTAPLRAAALQQALKLAGYNAIGFERPELAADSVQLAIAPARSDFRLAEILVTEENIQSDYPKEFPVGLRLILQTTITLSPAHFLISCSGPIGEASAHIVGAQAELGGGAASYPKGSTKRAFRISAPPLTPQGQFEIKVFSLTRIKCEVSPVDN
jgi:hypothetical protein